MTRDFLHVASGQRDFPPNQLGAYNEVRKSDFDDR
jgi:hypothetical protein